MRTRASRPRRDVLRRAVASVLAQKNVFVELVVVVNGDQPEQETLDWLRGDERIVTVMLPTQDLVRATSLGRSRVSGEFFSYLDDDDEFLPGALERRASWLAAHPDIDCVVTNGEYLYPDGRRANIPRLGVFASDPAEVIARGGNWMTSCGATFRSSTVPQKFFDDTTRWCEFKVIAFRVASDLQVAFVDEPTFRIHRTPHSAKTVTAHMDREFEVYDAMLRWNRNPERVPSLQKSRLRAFHAACAHHRLAGNFAQAWAQHWKSLASPYGLRYLPYTVLLLARVRQPTRALSAQFGPKQSTQE